MGSVNPKVLKDLRAISGPGFLIELVDLYLREATGHLGTLRQSIEARDERVLDRAAHTLKGSSGNMGAQALSRLSGEIQTAARAKDWTLAAELIVMIEAEYATVRAELEAEKTER
jgi:HPt (histidine-containing phosphotransfer) domain-containing protein